MRKLQEVAEKQELLMGALSHEMTYPVNDPLSGIRIPCAM